MTDWHPIPELSRPMVTWEGTDEDRVAVTRLLAEAERPEVETFAGTVVHAALSFGRLLAPEEQERLTRYLLMHYSADRLDLPDGAPVPTWPSALLPDSDRCWRCDAVPATTEVGCCGQCLADLQGRATEIE